MGWTTNLPDRPLPKPERTQVRPFTFLCVLGARSTWIRFVAFSIVGAFEGRAKKAITNKFVNVLTNEKWHEA
jgi:hypothetical protein